MTRKPDFKVRIPGRSWYLEWADLFIVIEEQPALRGGWTKTVRITPIKELEKDWKSAPDSLKDGEKR